MSRDTLRHYERRGLLPPQARSGNGYRQYAAAAVHRVRLIRAALSLGFTVTELAEILSDRDRGAAPCRRVHALALQKASSLEARISEMQALLRSLRLAISDWDRELKRAGPHARAGLLERFLDHHPETPGISPRMSPGLRERLERRRGEER